MALVVAGSVVDVHPIKGADRIRAATIDCGNAGVWRGVVTSEIRENDLVTVFLQDALLPADDPRWSFMEKHKWRVRMAKFKGAASECLILKLDDLDIGTKPLGTDLTSMYRVTKYSKTPPVDRKDLKCAFPSFLPKTDEQNIQSVGDWKTIMDSGPWYITEKADGVSCTAWKTSDGMLHVASRNWELVRTDTSAYWMTCEKYNLAETLACDTAIQFEVIGPGIQGNPMGVSELEGRLFSVFKNGKKAPFDVLRETSAAIGMPMATLLRRGTGSVDFSQLRALSDGLTYIHGKTAEGIVVRTEDQEHSFKVLSLMYDH